MADDPPALNARQAGLCASCAHVRSVTNPRGSLFLLCLASGWNPDLPKYPRLPVHSCPEYQPDHKDTRQVL